MQSGQVDGWEHPGILPEEMLDVVWKTRRKCFSPHDPEMWAKTEIMFLFFLIFAAFHIFQTQEKSIAIQHFNLLLFL